MKNLWFLTLLLIGFTAQAQQTAISLPQLNVLYIGVDNPVTIAVERYAAKDVVKEFLQGDIIERDGKTYLRVYTRGEATLRIGVKKRRGKIKWLEDVKFRVRKIPLALPQLGTLQDGAVVAKSAVQGNAQRLFLNMGEGFIMAGVLYQATSFDVTIIDSVSFKTFSDTGAVISAEIKDAIDYISEGGKIIINNVRYRLIKRGDTLSFEEPLTGNCEITVRPQTNTYTVEGGFYGTTIKLYYDSYLGNAAQWSGLVNYTRHGQWVYKTGACSQRVYLEEWYDSGRLTKYRWYDSTGFETISVDLPDTGSSIYYRELFNDSTVKREGWIITNRPGYRYRFTRNGDYCGPENLHPFQDFFKTFRFAPAGEWKEYRPGGQLKYKGSFSVDFPADGISDSTAEIKPAGVWTEYDETGNIISEYNFDNYFR